MMRTETVVKLARALQMNYCHPDYCGCGECSRLLFTPVAETDDPPWLPWWANGCDPEELYEWVQEEAWSNPLVAQALRDQGLNIYQRFKTSTIRRTTDE
jgi:hypothetical protein